jgi:phage regulator Rha-like protein
MSENLPEKPEGTTNFLLYTGSDGNVHVDVFLKDETVWLSQKAIAELFGKERSVITKHLKNVFVSGELDEKSNVQKMHFGHSDKPINFYNLDARPYGYQIYLNKDIITDDGGLGN